MIIYSYTREMVDGKWNVNNDRDVDEKGVSVNLSDRIKENESIGLGFSKMAAKESVVDITFSSDLTADEKVILDKIVADHKTASGEINNQTVISMMSKNGTPYNVCVSDLGVLEVMSAS